MDYETETCPICGSGCYRDSANVGVGIIYGPWGCECGWSEHPDYNLFDTPKKITGYIVDQYGGLTPETKGEN